MTKGTTDSERIERMRLCIRNMEVHLQGMSQKELQNLSNKNITISQAILYLLQRTGNNVSSLSSDVKKNLVTERNKFHTKQACPKCDGANRGTISYCMKRVAEFGEEYLGQLSNIRFSEIKGKELSPAKLIEFMSVTQKERFEKTGMITVGQVFNLLKRLDKARGTGSDKPHFEPALIYTGTPKAKRIGEKGTHGADRKKRNDLVKTAKVEERLFDNSDYKYPTKSKKSVWSVKKQ